MSNFSEAEIDAVSTTLEENTYRISDGFGYYTPSIVDGKWNPAEGYKRTMREIALEILTAQRKAGK